MAKLKLPEALKAWKVLSALPDKNGYPSYSVTLTEFDGTKTKAVLTVVEYEGDEYNSDNVDFVSEEAAFVKDVVKLRGVSNYIDAVVDNKPAKSKIALYLLTGDLPTLQDISKGKTFSDSDIVDFGLKMSEQLDKLEQSNILHGNLKPENIYVTPDGRYLAGGFTAFENDVEDNAFTAPEIVENTPPDYTTDIYSLGLMMYTMANDGKLPFEKDSDAAAATAKRLSKAPVSAPSNGSEKLKSVIVIACQPENKNRWKNAGNIKNALASIKAELPVSGTPAKAVIVPESTDFESNVFEEFAFDEPEVTQEPAKQDSPVVPAAVAAVAAAAVAAGAGAMAATQPSAVSEIPEIPEIPEAPQSPAAPAADAAVSSAPAEQSAAQAMEPEIDNRVFDDYTPETKVFNINDAMKNNEKDYGDFFEEEPEKKEAPAVAPVAAASAAAASAAPAQAPADNFAGNAFYHEDVMEEEPEEEPEKTDRKGVIAVILIIVALLLALAAYGVFAYQKSWFPFNLANNANQNSAATTAVATDATAPAATTATVPGTTASTVPSTTGNGSDTTVVPADVIGFFYDYATDVLEAQGYQVVRNYEYNNNVDEGIVFAMSPDSSQPLAKGSTVTLTVSKGSENGGSRSTESSQSDSSDNDADSGDSDSDADSGESRSESSSDNDSENYVQTAAQTRNSAAPASNTSTAAVSAPASSSQKMTYMRVNRNNDDNGDNFSAYKNNTSYLTKEEVNAMSREELNLALNEIYARRGRIFTTASLASYFNSQSWYKPLYDADAFYENVVFNDYESRNVDLIRKVQEEKGYY